ncbi:hypothetical protein OS493_012795 [Desmophyllum pertusum]|uniref:Carbamoyl phosphate synthase ATP-binding domain-containing protein n=1 Tax=Desmophyllum pertusum TaxID=174260 RepID=A0A9W9ZGH4_9CNID|nr:hypothetical protein OS493_012795 [Desmophyllum pertusum]
MTYRMPLVNQHISNSGIIHHPLFLITRQVAHKASSTGYEPSLVNDVRQSRSKESSSRGWGACGSWHRGTIRTVAEAKAFCEEYGLPVITKAAYGGGGRGMRVIHKMEDVEEFFNLASNEAYSAFGDGSMFIEKFVGKCVDLLVWVYMV